MSLDLKDAVRYNDRAANRVGWSSRFSRIVDFLGDQTEHGRTHFTSTAPSSRDFALAVAEWQEDARLLVDGKLGPNSWRRMSRQLDESPEGFVFPWHQGALHGTLLTGFDFDRSDLKPAHVDWLAKFAKRLPQLSHVVYLVGMTDRSGSASYNRRLSLRRARSVYGYLRTLVPASLEARLQVVGAGEELAQAGSERSANDRGVAVVYTPSGQAPAVPAWFTEMLRPQPTRVFFIRSLGGYTMGASVPGPAGVGISASQFGIEISDGVWSQLFWLEFASAVASISDAPPTKLPFSGGLTTHGPWHLFRLPVDRTVNDFGLGTSVVIGKATASFAAKSFGPVALQFHHPGFRLDPFLMGKGIKLELTSAGIEGGGGELRRRSRWPIMSGVDPQIQRRLMNGVKPGPSTLESVSR